MIAGGETSAGSGALGRPFGGAVYLRLSTRPVEQPKRTIDETLARDMVDGAYWLRPPGPNADVVIAFTGAVAPEAIEAGGLLVRLTDGSERQLLLPESQVFEDLRPRLADLDKDGEAEVIVVRSSLKYGAVLTVYGLVGDDLQLIAEGPQNLTSHRWLNPVGAADFDGDGDVEVAYVETPHIGGILRILSLQDGKLLEEASWAGFSNHLIGSRELGLSAILDFNEDGLPEIFLPSARRRSIRIMRYQDGELKLLGRDFYDAQIIGDFRLEDLDGNGMDEVIFRLDDGLEVRLYR